MDFTPVYGTLNENQLLKVPGPAKPRGGYRHVSFTCHDIPLSGKNTTVDFPPVDGTSNEFQLLTQQSQEGDTDIPGTVYCHGIPLSGKKIRCRFLF